MKLFRRRKAKWAENLARIVIVGRDLPDVHECYGHIGKAAKLLYGDVSECSQCDGSHTHKWVYCLVLNGNQPATATRCLVCGGRKCDNSSCLGRRHHSDAHIYANGRIQEVGA